MDLTEQRRLARLILAEQCRDTELRFRAAHIMELAVPLARAIVEQERTETLFRQDARP